MSPLAFGLGSSRAFGIARKLGRLYTLGESVEGGYFAGYISHTANGIATHALIVSPKSTGEAPLSTQWKTVASSTPGTDSRFDGFLNTTNMIASGTSHPAAEFCVGLNIGGYTDWYLPAIDELQIAYYNLKPTTSNNSTFHGINAYSVPAIVSNYTTTDPAQTSITIFRSGGSQVLTSSATGDLPGYTMWCSTQGSSAQTAFSIEFTAGGYNDAAFKTNGAYVRAFRRIPL